jgi:wobble nucleotide-excising tRNase
MTEIAQFKRLKNLGIFRQFVWDGLKDFNKLNLIYGWNGSGKSTLSAVFEALELKTALDPTHYEQAEYQIVSTGGTTFDDKNVDQCNLPISTFNRGFVSRHIDWDKQLKGILLIDQKKITEVEQLNEKKKVASSKNQEVIAARAEITEAQKKRQDFLTQAAKRIRISLQIIATTDARYLNYDRTKLGQLIESNQQGLRSGSFVQTDARVIELTKEASPATKSILVTEFALSVSKDRYKKAFERLSELLLSTAENTAIERLKTHPDLQEWVATGLELHKAHESKECEFCGALLRTDRLDLLGKHFNTNYLEFQERLNKATIWLNDQTLQIPTLPNDDQLYEELQETYRQARLALSNSTQEFNAQLSKWAKVLSEKVTNQSLGTLFISQISDESLDRVQKCISDVTGILKRHNAKTKNFLDITKKAKDELELHYTSIELKDFDYFAKLEDTEKAIIEEKNLSDQLEKTQNEAAILEKSLSTTGLGADEFNKHLHRFLGHSEISLKIASGSIGYVIARGNSTKRTTGLSEGEKTAIALVYFMTKLKENGRTVSDQIVVLDDPISSFDSKHLFQAYAYIKEHCKDASQLFILTHNYTFFKLIRDWYDANNKNRSRKHPAKTPNANFYVLDVAMDGARQAIIKDAPISLIRYNSEYHYLFEKLNNFRAQGQLNIEGTYLAANLSRKLLETFFAFKFPNTSKDDFKALCDAAAKRSNKTDSVASEKIYRFINKYSHSNSIEMTGEATENTQGESGQIVQQIFEWVEDLDKTHYDEMLSAVAP